MPSPTALRRLRADDGPAALVFYRAYSDRADCPPRKDFLAAVSKYELAYMLCGEEVMGVASRRDGSVHIGVLPTWRGRWATRSFIREILSWAGETGKVWTRISPGNTLGERLVKGVGFVENGGRYELQQQP